jgi:hypothetical protein
MALSAQQRGVMRPPLLVNGVEVAASIVLLAGEINGDCIR